MVTATMKAWSRYNHERVGEKKKKQKIVYMCGGCGWVDLSRMASK